MAPDSFSKFQKQDRDQLAIETDAWLDFVKRLKLPNGKPLPGNAFKVAEDIARNRERGFNRTIFEYTSRLEAWPAIETIAAATGTCRRTVERMLAVLRDAGCLIVQSGRGRHKNDRFQGVQNATALSHFSRSPNATAPPENATALSEKMRQPCREKCDSSTQQDATPVRGVAEEAGGQGERMSKAFSQLPLGSTPLLTDTVVGMNNPAGDDPVGAQFTLSQLASVIGAQLDGGALAKMVKDVHAELQATKARITELEKAR
jgi:hypothetical protein